MRGSRSRSRLKAYSFLYKIPRGHGQSHEAGSWTLATPAILSGPRKRRRKRSGSELCNQFNRSAERAKASGGVASCKGSEKFKHHPPRCRLSLLFYHSLSVAVCEVFDHSGPSE